MKATFPRLDVTHPDLSKQWHPNKNGSLQPSDVSFGSCKIVWWFCPNCGSEYDALIKERSHGSGCPFCHGKRVNHTNCLATKNTTLAKEWHPTLNNDKTPYDFTHRSGKKVWWLCPKCSSNYKMTIDNRTTQKCPYCAGKKVNETNSLQSINPTLAKEWHPTKNDNKTPNNFTCFAHDKVLWLCPNCGSDFDACISDRARENACPFCAGKKVNETNSLQSINPTLAKEWHPTKNDNKTPNNFTCFSNDKVWWICQEPNCKSYYDARIADRSIGTKCPKCSLCKNERLTGDYLKSLFPQLTFDSQFSVRHPQYKYPLKIDYQVVINNQSYFIEYNGAQHYQPVCFNGISLEEAKINFKKQKKRDKRLRKYCLKNNITLIEIDGRKHTNDKILTHLEEIFATELKMIACP